jgi:hypothetical protein
MLNDLNILSNLYLLLLIIVKHELHYNKRKVKSRLSDIKRLISMFEYVLVH